MFSNVLIGKNVISRHFTFRQNPTIPTKDEALCNKEYVACVALIYQVCAENTGML